MKIDTYACDVCKAHKGEGNHWWVMMPDDRRMIIAPWLDTAIDHDDLFHLCGAACVQKKVAEFLGAK